MRRWERFLFLCIGLAIVSSQACSSSRAKGAESPDDAGMTSVSAETPTIVASATQQQCDRWAHSCWTVSKNADTEIVDGTCYPGRGYFCELRSGAVDWFDDRKRVVLHNEGCDLWAKVCERVARQEATTIDEGVCNDGKGFVCKLANGKTLVLEEYSPYCGALNERCEAEAELRGATVVERSCQNNGKHMCRLSDGYVFRRGMFSTRR